MATKVPKKSKFRLGEVCEFTDTQPYVLQFWETEFPQLRPKVGGNGTRIYTRKDLLTVLRIKTLLQDKNYSITDARKILDSTDLSEELPKGLEELTNTSVEKQKASSEATDSNGSAQSDSATRTPVVSQLGSKPAKIDKARYDVAVREIQRLKAEISALENDAREGWVERELLDQAESRIGELEQSLAQAQEAILKQQEQIDARKEKLESLAAKIENIASALDPSA